MGFSCVSLWGAAIPNLTAPLTPPLPPTASKRGVPGLAQKGVDKHAKIPLKAHRLSNPGAPFPPKCAPNELKENDMYAIVKHGGHQLKVTQGAKITVNRLAGEVGSSVELADVLLVNDGSKTTVGTPTVAGAKVAAKILSHSQGDKVIIFKKRRRQNSRRKNGFRASLTTLEITAVSAK